MIKEQAYFKAKHLPQSNLSISRIVFEPQTETKIAGVIVFVYWYMDILQTATPTVPKACP